MKLKLVKIKHNQTEVVIEQYTFCFSSNVCVAVYTPNGLICSENVWSRITGNHLNYWQPNKNKRLSFPIFEEKLKDILEQKLPNVIKGEN